MDNAYLYSAPLSLFLVYLLHPDGKGENIRRKIWSCLRNDCCLPLPLRRLTTCQNSGGGRFSRGCGGVEDSGIRWYFFESDSPSRLYTPMIIITFDNVSLSNLFNLFLSFSVPLFRVNWICLIMIYRVASPLSTHDIHEVCSASIYRLLHSCLVSFFSPRFLQEIYLPRNLSIL